MRNLSRTPVLLIAALLVFGLVACTSEPSAQDNEADTRQSNYEKLVANQPAKKMNYTPTRETVNFWIDTWDEPGKLSFVYLLAANGQLVGYYVFEGLPVSYCVSLAPNYEIDSSTNGKVVVPAPAMDGVYYSEAPCDTYYGKDATTGSYLEYSAGQGINPLVYEEPLPRQDVEPLGFTTIDDAEDLMEE